MPCIVLMVTVSQRQTHVHLLELEIVMQEAPKESLYLRVYEIATQVESETYYFQ